MAKKCLINKQQQKPKFSARKYNRCLRCGRPGGYLRRFKMCRICVRQLASNGMIPGVIKASW